MDEIDGNSRDHSAECSSDDLSASQIVHIPPSFQLFGSTSKLNGGDIYGSNLRPQYPPLISPRGDVDSQSCSGACHHTGDSCFKSRPPERCSSSPSLTNRKRKTSLSSSPGTWSSNKPDVRFQEIPFIESTESPAVRCFTSRELPQQRGIICDQSNFDRPNENRYAFKFEEDPTPDQRHYAAAKLQTRALRDEPLLSLRTDTPSPEAGAVQQTFLNQTNQPFQTLQSEDSFSNGRSMTGSYIQQCTDASDQHYEEKLPTPKYCLPDKTQVPYDQKFAFHGDLNLPPPLQSHDERQCRHEIEELKAANHKQSEYIRKILNEKLQLQTKVDTQALQLKSYSQSVATGQPHRHQMAVSQSHFDVRHYEAQLATFQEDFESERRRFAEERRKLEDENRQLQAAVVAQAQEIMSRGPGGGAGPPQRHYSAVSQSNFDVKLYEDQLAMYKEDFENEKREKQIAKSSADSLREQLTMVFRELSLLRDKLIKTEEELERYKNPHRVQTFSQNYFGSERQAAFGEPSTSGQNKTQLYRKQDDLEQDRTIGSSAVPVTQKSTDGKERRDLDETSRGNQLCLIGARSCQELNTYNWVDQYLEFQKQIPALR